MSLKIDKFTIKTIRILCQSLHYCQTFPDRPFPVADGTVCRCGDLADDLQHALTDCPLLTARYTGSEVYNSLKQSLSLKQLQARIHRGRTQTCKRLAKERQRFMKAMTLLDIESVAEAVRQSPTQRVCRLDTLFHCTIKIKLMKVD
ncbi:hypothetical protein [Oenococcus sp.]|uniref:hypothetical protein n=1 Tax=Oenococcus sp. TaxID=1979414 RepID=UPI0039ECD2C7